LRNTAQTIFGRHRKNVPSTATGMPGKSLSRSGGKARSATRPLTCSRIGSRSSGRNTFAAASLIADRDMCRTPHQRLNVRQAGGLLNRAERREDGVVKVHEQEADVLIVEKFPIAVRGHLTQRLEEMNELPQVLHALRDVLLLHPLSPCRRASHAPQ